MGQTGLLKQITNNRQSFSALFALAVMMLSLIASTFAMAAPLTVMSITPSTASVDATAGSVSYRVQFTPEANAAAFVIDFCDNTPLLGQSCTAPTGMDVDGATSADTTVETLETAMDANTIVATEAMTAATPVDITFAGLTNPTSPDTIYARIVTFGSTAAAGGYVSNNPSAVGAVVDNGSVSLFFNEDVTVSGTVLETMTFCVSGTTISPNCGDATVPTIALGEDQGGGLLALVPGTVSTGALHTQMNTNASGGAVVRLKSSASCGGLMRLGSDECNIAAAGNTNVIGTDNSAKFGVRLGTATTAVGASNPVGTLAPYDADGEGVGVAFYDTTNYKLNWNDDDSVGITSVIGDPLLYTAGAPATNQNMEMTFAASIGTDTPAGTYSTDLSLIAVGTF